MVFGCGPLFFCFTRAKRDRLCQPLAEEYGPETDCPLGNAFGKPMRMDFGYMHMAAAHTHCVHDSGSIVRKQRAGRVVFIVNMAETNQDTALPAAIIIIIIIITHSIRSTSDHSDSALDQRTSPPLPSTQPPLPHPSALPVPPRDSTHTVTPSARLPY